MDVQVNSDRRIVLVGVELEVFGLNLEAALRATQRDWKWLAGQTNMVVFLLAGLKNGQGRLDSSQIERICAAVNLPYEVLSLDYEDEGRQQAIELAIQDVQKPSAADLSLGKLASGVGELVAIPIDQIRVRKDQPRQYFDEDGLRSLAESIAAIGQTVPGIVVPLEDAEDGYLFELDDGERRLRACKLAGITVFKAIVKDDTQESGLRFMRSVVANFSREDHTLLEKVGMVIRLVEEFGYTQAAVARASNLTPAWINQLYGLRRLHPDVRVLLDQSLPREKQLSFNMAVRLSALSQEEQLKLAPELRGVAAHLIGHAVKTAARRHGVKLSGHKRKPADAFRVFTRAAKAVGGRITPLAEMDPDEFDHALKGRRLEDLQALYEELKAMEAQAAQLRSKVESYLVDRTEG